MTSRRRSSPERIAVARVSGIAKRHSWAEPIDVEAALAEIRAVPAVSPALLAEAAGLTLGYYHEAMDWSTRIIEAGLLIGAGADLDQADESADVLLGRPHGNVLDCGAACASKLIFVA